MISEIEIFIRLILSAVLGGIVGYERQVHGRPAGFRTHLIVSVASALIMIVSEYYHYLAVMDPTYVRVDPGRIAAGAITGVGFLGAGVILRMGATIQGLTTAACIWMVSAMGLSVGAGLYLSSIWACAITLFSLLALRAVERKMYGTSYKFITVVAGEGMEEENIISILAGHNVRVINMDYEKDALKEELAYNITISLKGKVAMKSILDSIASLASVKKVSIKSG